MLNSRMKLSILSSLAMLFLTSCGQPNNSNVVLQVETGEALAVSIQAAIDRKDAAMLGELTAFNTGDDTFLRSIYQQITTDISVKSVEFSSTLSDDQAEKLDPTDGDILVSFTEPSVFATRGGATIAKVTQISLPAMKIDGVYRVHGRRGLGISDIAF